MKFMMMLLPLTVEKDLARLLLSSGRAAYVAFINWVEGVHQKTDCVPAYEVSIRPYREEGDRQKGWEKRWYRDMLRHLEELGKVDGTVLIDFWIHENQSLCEAFVEQFKTAYNKLAEQRALDYLL